ncbi:MAG: bifunctional diaminohydroxyphosphoribosylaminopyrimidine deaminase/5-amino-6-(5-phosphoribosylamino)uracil reductase RibD [Desulfovibrio sp.]|nr:bifunctional diaminohydroxyphosphoribosylaminopyrimidine deaminase/5-amino-6-(5-phosphoribosylamino)uracil reductase RibD [Desulfovibrio sp.]
MSAEAYAVFMQAAIKAASQSQWLTHPNPCVGAVLVRDEQIVAQGWHHAAGKPHAEVECLRDASDKGLDPSLCTLVVTLEPCKHFGKTPPCTEAILKAGIKKVVIGCMDPTSEAGGGAEILRAAGVEVIGPVCEESCRDLIADFLVWKNEARPYLILKMAATMDGRIATRTGQSQWISCAESRESVHRLRQKIGQAKGLVLVGGKTFRLDNPHLTYRLPDAAPTPQPLACIFTSHLPQDKDEFWLLQERPEETIFLSSAAAAASTQAQELRKRGVRVFPVPQYSNGTTDLRGLLKTLYRELNCPYVLCEGGGELAISLLEEQLVDEFHLHLAPTFLADNDAMPLFNNRMPLTLAEAISLRCTQTRLVGNDVHVLLRPRPDEA